MKNHLSPLAIKLSGSDIKKKEFDRAFRGYSTKEVHEYLDMLAGCWDRMLRQEKDLFTALHSLNQELEGWKAREGELARFREQALAEAEQIRSAARDEANQVTEEAEACASRVRERTETWLEGVISKVEETQRQKANFVTAFRSALDSHYELLQQETSHDVPLSEQLSELLRDSHHGAH